MLNVFYNVFTVAHFTHHPKSLLYRHSSKDVQKQEPQREGCVVLRIRRQEEKIAVAHSPLLLGGNLIRKIALALSFAQLDLV